MATIVGGAALILGTAGSADALSAAINYTSQSGMLENSGFNGNIGFRFTVGNSDISVDALGVFDWNQDGLNSDHEVGIFNGTNLIVSTTVSEDENLTTFDGFYRYTNITPVTLLANQFYTITSIGWNQGGLDDSYGNGSVSLISSIAPEITYNGNFAASGNNTLVPNGTLCSNQCIAGPNFSIASSAAVPFEFSPTLGLVAMSGIFGLSRLRKRTSNSKAINGISA